MEKRDGERYRGKGEEGRGMDSCGMWVSKEIKSIWSIVYIVSEKADGLSTMNYYQERGD